jgi:hypothetical protein
MKSFIQKRSYSTNSTSSRIFNTKRLALILGGVWLSGFYVSQSVWYEKELNEEDKNLEEYKTFPIAVKTRVIRFWNGILKNVTKTLTKEMEGKKERETEILMENLNKEIKIEVGENAKIKNLITEK